MDTNFEQNKQAIVNALTARVAQLKCPICGNASLTLGGGFFAHDLQHDLSKRQMGGMNIPTVPIICSHCGYVMEFAAGTLGLLPKSDDKKVAPEPEDEK
jgi:hypothetical protein